MRRVAAYLMHLGPYTKPLPIQLYPATTGTISKNVPPWGTGGLVAHKQHIVSGFSQHGFKIINHPTPGAHAGTGQHHTGAMGASKVIHSVQMVLVGVNHR